MGKKKKKPTLKAPPWNGDHGPGTAAAVAGTHIEPIEGPNRMARRVRQAQSDVWKPQLSLRQYQAARAIEDAYCAAMRLTSGGDSIGKVFDLRTTVQSSPKPDAVVDRQVAATARLRLVMGPVPSAMRPVVEHLFWHNRALGSFVQGRAFYNRAADVKVALDLVANALRY